jgi:DNA-binding response OmpR family regulator/putative methionine-R-sulfoxide reductase with GAF domain
VSQHRVLVVDDELFFRELIGDVLTNAGIAYVTAATGADALELAADPEVGVVVLDLELPDLHGLEVFRRVKQQRPTLRIVILSASTQEEHVLEALRLGAFDYLAKPLHEEELLLSVRRALETYGIANGWLGLRSRVDRLQASLAELWSRARAEGASPEDLRSLAVQAAAEVLGAARTSLMLLDDQADSLKVVAAVGNKVATEAMDAVPVGQGVAGLAHARGEALLVSDVAADARFATRQAPGAYGTRSFAVAPLTAGARTLGVLCATERSGGGAFDAEDLALLRIIAVQVAHMLQAPPVHVSAPAAAAPADVEIDVDIDEPALTETTPAGAASAATPEPSLFDAPSDRGANLAREICDAVTAEVEPARILDAALRPISAALGAAPVSIYLRSAETGELTREAEFSDDGRRTDRAQLSASRGLAGSVLATGQLVATADPTADPRFDATLDTPEGGAASALVCGALRFRGKSIGIFRAFPADGANASAELGELIAAALSAAVRNVLLYRSLVESIEEVAQARRAARTNAAS